MPEKRQVNVMVRVTEAERRRLKVKTGGEGTSIQAVLYACIQAYLKGKVKHG